MNKVVTSVVILGLLGAVGYLLYKRKKDSERPKFIEPKKEIKPEKELKVIPKAELKIKDQLKKIEQNVVQNRGVKKDVLVDDLVVPKDKKALQYQLLPKRPVFTGGGSGAVILETNIDKNVAPQRGVGRKEVPMNRPSEKLSELI